MTTPTRTMKVGVAGLGAGAVQVIRAMANAPFRQLIRGRGRAAPGA